ncbi:hypothetical protein BH11ACT4_BH11ACT4_24900 [soil metagenome]
MPYAVGEFRADWERYPVLVRQFHPEFNSGITLSQVPPAADVYLLWECEVGHQFVATPWEQRQRPGRSRRRSTWCPECAAGSGAGPERSATRLCGRTPALAAGEAFASLCAPRTASAAEALLRQKLDDRLEYTPGLNAIRVGRAFFDHLEIWPDIVLPELRVAIEYDTIGRDGLEHVGRREPVDRRKDRILRAAGWEVVRVRCGKLQPLGRYDVNASGSISGRLVDSIVDRLREARGDLIVNCYLR